MLGLLIISLLQATSALIGYDCGSHSLNVTTISLLDVGECEPPQNTLNITRRYIQLLQINEYFETNVIQCKVEVKRTLYHCGMFSHSSIMEHGMNEYIDSISREACRDAHVTGTMRIIERTITGLKLNQTTTHPVTLAGSLKEEGGCKCAPYADPFGSWECVVVQGLLKVTLQSQLGRVDLDNNKIYFRSGTSCQLSGSNCIDIEGGYSFWDPIPKDNCKFDRYGILFEGMANKFTDSEFNNENVVYSIASQDVTFALTSTSKENICGYIITRTEHPKLVILETVQGNSFAKPSKISVKNLDMFAYVNSKFVYVEKYIRTQIKFLYQDVVLHRCNLERQELKNALAIAMQAPDQFAYNLMKGPGFIAVTSGETAHIIKCIPVEVALYYGENCYSELPVTRKNQTYYLTPRTHILKSKGTRVECNSLLPSQYFVNQRWYEVSPNPIPSKKNPITINPLSGFTWKYVSPTSLATSGIYTQHDLDELKEHIMFPVERLSLLNDVAREMHGRPVSDNEGTIMKLLNESTMEKLIESTWGKLWAKFMDFGTASAGFLALFFVLQALKMLIDIIINGVLIHQVYGWSLHLFGAIWSSVAQLLVNLAAPKPTRNDYTMRYDVEQPNLVDIQQQQQRLLEETTVHPNPIPVHTEKTPKRNSGHFFKL